MSPHVFWQVAKGQPESFTDKQKQGLISDVHFFKQCRGHSRVFGTQLFVKENMLL